MGRKKKRRTFSEREYQRADSIANLILGLFFGIILGGSIGLGVCIWVLPGTLFFEGDTVLAGAVIGAIGGWWYGDPFIEGMKDLMSSWWW